MNTAFSTILAALIRSRPESRSLPSPLPPVAGQKFYVLSSDRSEGCRCYESEGVSTKSNRKHARYRKKSLQHPSAFLPNESEMKTTDRKS